MATTNLISKGSVSKIVVGNQFTINNNVTAGDVSIVDAGGYYDSDNVEGALQEVGADLASGVSTSADKVSIADAGGYYSSTDVEGALEEVGALTNEYGEGVFAVGGGDGKITQGNTSEGVNGVQNTAGFTGNQYKSTIQMLTISAGLIAWDMSLGQRAKVTLTESATLSNPTNAAAAFPDLEVLQDGTGGRVLSFDSNFVLPTNFSAVATTANSYALYHFQLRSDGKLAVAVTAYAS